MQSDCVGAPRGAGAGGVLKLDRKIDLSIISATGL